MEGSGVEFEANDGKDEDGKGDKEANLERKFYTQYIILNTQCKPACLIVFLDRLTRNRETVSNLHEWGKRFENGLEDNL